MSLCAQLIKNKENMKTKVVKSFMLLAAVPETSASNSPLSYLIGGIIAVLIMGYLVYTLLRPDKF
jgi:K+-transporting ATPase KdpF subunit